MSAITDRQDTRRKVVYELYKNGFQAKEIADQVDASIVTVYKDLRVLGLREKGEYSPLHREAISKGVRKIKALEQLLRSTPSFCCECGKVAKNRFKKKVYCDEHLITAYGNPDYESEQRAAAGGRFTSHGRTY